tara:strand:- start:307 stop:561 length:255 start_codon:yes stop_codon:yes gene_type:complete
MAIKKDTDKVAEKKNGMNIVDNMDGEKNAEKKLNIKVAGRPGRKRLLQIYNDSEIERELGPGSGYSTDELFEILFKLHGNMINN